MYQFLSEKQNEKWPDAGKSWISTRHDPVRTATVESDTSPD
jgi:hypothetical protein